MRTPILFSGRGSASSERTALRARTDALGQEIIRTALVDLSAKDLVNRSIPNRGQGGSTYDAYLGTSLVTPGSADPSVPVFDGNRSVRLPGIVGNYVGTGANVDLTGDVVLIARIRPTAFVASSEIIGNRAGTAGEAQLRFDTTGTKLEGFWFVSGIGYVQQSAAHGLNLNEWVWVGYTRQNNNGSGNSVNKFYKSTDGVSWTQIGSDVLGAVATPTPNPSILRLGGNTVTFNGQISNAIVGSGYNISSYTPVAEFNARQCGQTGYTGTLGNAWTVFRASTGLKSMLVDEDPPLLLGTDDRVTIPAKLLPATGMQFTALCLRRHFSRPAVAGYMFIGRNGADGFLTYNNGTTDSVIGQVYVSGAPKISPGVTVTYGALGVQGMIVDATNVYAVHNTTIGSPTTLAGTIDAQASTTTWLSHQDDAEDYRWLFWPRALTQAELNAVCRSLEVA